MEDEPRLNNTTNITFHQDDHDVRSVAVITVEATILSLIICMAILGNLLILTAIYRFPRLRTFTNVFVANLAVADLLLALFGMPFTMVSSITYKWVFGDIMCKIQGFTNSLFCEASVLTLTFVSLERFIAIIYPLSYANLLTSRNVTISLCFIWMQGLVCASSTFWFSKFTFLEFEHICTVDWGFNPDYTITFTVVFFFVPCFIVVIFYSIILKTALRQQKRIGTLKVGEIQQNDELKLPTTKKANLENFRKKRREHKATIMIAIVVGTFCACWLPHIIGMYCLIIPSCHWSSGFFITSTWLAMLNSALNSAIYGLLNATFRRAIKSIIACGRYNGDGLSEVLKMAWEKSKQPQSHVMPNNEAVSHKD